MKNLSAVNENKDVVTKEYVDTGLGGKQPTLVSGSNIKTINNQSVLGSGNMNIETILVKHIDTSDSSQWDSEREQPTQTVLQDIGTHEYGVLSIENIDLGENNLINIKVYLSAKLDSNDFHVRQYVRFEEGDDEDNEPTEIETITIGNIDSENPTTYIFTSTPFTITRDVKINGNSIVESSVANIVTNTAYNPSTNKIATMSDIPINVEQKLSYILNGETFYYQFYGVKTLDGITVNVGTEVDVVYATLILINSTIDEMIQGYIPTLSSIQAIHIPDSSYESNTLIINIHNLGCMTCYIDSSTKYVTEAIFTNFAQGYSVNFGANPNALTIYYSATDTVKSTNITNIIACTTAQYNSSSKDSDTIYLITD